MEAQSVNKVPRHGYRYQFGTLERDPRIRSPPTRWHLTPLAKMIGYPAAVGYAALTGLIYLVRDSSSSDEKKQRALQRK